MNDKVPNDQPEREPGIKHYYEPGDPNTWCGISLDEVAVAELTQDKAAVTDSGCLATLVAASNFDADRAAEALAAMTVDEARGLRAAFADNPLIVLIGTEVRDLGGTDVANAARLLVEAPRFATLTERERRAVLARFVVDPAALDDLAISATDPAELPEPAPAPERRTVSLEVLTPELRDVAVRLARSDVREEMAAANVAVVLRAWGQVVAVPDTDVPWVYTPGGPVKALRGLLSEMISGKNRLEREDGRPVELLMPTPDVLAVLAGQPDTRLLSAPVHVLAMDIQAGMLLRSTDDDGDGAETLELVSAERDCTDRDCIYGATCVVLTVEGHEDPDVHFNGFARIEVRIPAAEVVAP